MNRTSAVACSFLLTLSFSVAGAETLKTTYNPFTGKLDYYTSMGGSAWPGANSSGCLSNDGSGNLSWAACSGGSGTPSAPLNSVQYNSASTFAGNANFTTDGSSVTVSTMNVQGTFISSPTTTAPKFYSTRTPGPDINTNFRFFGNLHNQCGNLAGGTFTLGANTSDCDGSFLITDQANNFADFSPSGGLSFSLTGGANSMTYGNKTLQIPGTTVPAALPTFSVLYHGSSEDWLNIMEQGQAYGILADSQTTGITIGHVAVFSSTNGAVIDGGVNGGQGNAILNQSTLQVGATAFTDFVYVNSTLTVYGATLMHTTVTILGAQSSIFTNLSSFTITGAQVLIDSNTVLPSTTFYADGNAQLPTVTVNNNLTAVKGLYYGTINTVTLAYTAVSTDNVVLADATGGAFTVTLPAASGAKGQNITVIKNDTTAGVVTVAPNGTDVIISTRAVPLYAKGQQVRLISDGSSTWWAPDGLQAPPQILGPTSGGTVAAALPGINQAIFDAVYVPIPVAVSTITFKTGTASGNCDVGLYDNNGQKLYSKGSFVCPATGTPNTVTFAPLTLMPGTYYLVFTADNVTNTIAFAGNNSAGSALNFTNFMPLPSSATLSNGTLAGKPVALNALVNGGSLK